MAISLRAAGTMTSATAAVTAVDPAVPTGTTTGDLSVLTVVAKPYTTTITTPTGWTKIGEATSGTVAGSLDAGSMKVAVYVRESAPTGAIGAIGQSGADSMGAVIHSYSKRAVETWDYSSWTSGVDTTATGWSATGAANLNLLPGDWVLALSAINTDAGTTSAGQITAAGATFGTVANRIGNGTTGVITTGNDSRISTSDRPVTGGISTAAPVHTWTNSSLTTTARGVTLFLRLRPNGPKTETLVDDFNTDQRPTNWPDSYGINNVAGGVGTVTSSAAQQYSGLQSSTTPGNQYTFKESYFKVKWTIPTVAGNYGPMLMPLPANGNDLKIQWESGTLYFGQRVGYTFSNSFSMAVAGGTTLYVGMGEGVAGAAKFGKNDGVAGTSYFFSSTDGSSWTLRHSLATPVYHEAVTIILDSDSLNDAVSTYDDVNVDSGTPATVTAVTATATAAALAPAAAAGATVTAVPATATSAALAPGVGIGATVTAVAATATATALPPAITAGGTITAVRAQAAAGALAPAVTAGAVVTGVLAQATAAALAPTVSAAAAATVQAVPATATAAALVPTLAAGATLAAPTAAAVAAALAPTVSAATGTTVTAVAATAQAAALAPTVQAGATVQGSAATATAAARVPTVAAGGTVAAVRAQASAAALAPAPTAAAVVQAVAATAAAAALAPSVGAGATATVTAVRATATAQAYAATVTAGGTITATRAQATALARVPGISAGAVTYVPRATALAQAFAAGVFGGDIGGSILAGYPLARRWGIEELLVREYAVDPEPEYAVTELAARWASRPLAGRWLITPEVEMAVDVLATAGAVKFVGGTVREVTGKDISGATYMMSLGSATEPGSTWVAPDQNLQGANLAERILKLKVSSTLPAGIVVPGEYWVWARITDSQEIEPVRLQGPIRVR